MTLFIQSSIEVFAAAGEEIVLGPGDRPRRCPSCCAACGWLVVFMGPAGKPGPPEQQVAGEPTSVCCGIAFLFSLGSGFFFSMLTGSGLGESQAVMGDIPLRLPAANHAARALSDSAGKGACNLDSSKFQTGRFAAKVGPTGEPEINCFCKN